MKVSRGQAVGGVLHARQRSSPFVSHSPGSGLCFREIPFGDGMGRAPEASTIRWGESSEVIVASRGPGERAESPEIRQWPEEGEMSAARWTLRCWE